jgi:hypothetical protein
MTVNYRKLRGARRFTGFMDYAGGGRIKGTAIERIKNRINNLKTK